MTEKYTKWNAALAGALIMAGLGGVFFAPAAPAQSGEMVQITELDDLGVTDVRPGISSDTILTDDICVHSTSGLYQITATGRLASGFGMQHQLLAETVAYSVEWRDQPGGSFTAVQNGLALNGQVGSTVQNCSGSDLATLRITIAGEALTGVSSGSYDDTLTLTVGPE